MTNSNYMNNIQVQILKKKIGEQSNSLLLTICFTHLFFHSIQIKDEGKNKPRKCGLGSPDEDKYGQVQRLVHGPKELTLCVRIGNSASLKCYRLQIFTLILPKQIRYFNYYTEQVIR